MKRIAMAIAVLIVATVAHAQDLIVLPTEGKLLGYVSAPEPGKWVVIEKTEFVFVQPTVLEGGKSIMIEGTAGKYGVIYFPPGDDTQPMTQVVVLGGGEPDPPDPPEPSGPWQIMMFYDAQYLDDYQPEKRLLLNSLILRDKLEADGHVFLEALEKSDIRDGVPSRYTPWVNAVLNDPLPRIALAPLEGGKVMDFPLPENVEAL